MSHNKFCVFIFAMILALFVFLPDLFAKEAPIFLHYSERPPYMVTRANGHVDGLCAGPAELAFKRAKLPFTWVKTPTNRQFLLMKENSVEGRERHCGICYYKTTEREQFATFTNRYYQSQGSIVLARKQVHKKPYRTFEEFLKHYSILVKDNYSYGPFVDALLLKIKPEHVSTSGDVEQMIQMVAKGHGDFLVISREEAQFYFKKGSAQKHALHVLTFPDLPKKLYRHILCSKSVDQKTMARINSALLF